MSDCTTPEIKHNVSLKKYHTFGTDAVAERLIEIATPQQLEYAIKHHLFAVPYVVLGGGSNIVFADHYRGTVFHIATKGITVVKESADNVWVEAAGGEVWDVFVRHCMKNGWHGLENLAAIPGTVGASAVQNIGAYGAEAADCIEHVKAVNIENGEKLRLDREQCRFGYRDSIFKHGTARRYIITSVVYRLQRRYVPNIKYQALTERLRNEGIAEPTAEQVFEAITDLRWSKLPRPEEVGSAGSFFKNPVVTVSHYERLLHDYPKIVAYPAGDGYKLAAGWLIEQCGWRGRSIGRCGVWEKQSLVLVNLGGCDFEDIRRVANAVSADVEARFGVALEREAIYVDN